MTKEGTLEERAKSACSWCRVLLSEFKRKAGEQIAKEATQAAFEQAADRLEKMCVEAGKGSHFEAAHALARAADEIRKMDTNGPSVPQDATEPKKDS